MLYAVDMRDIKNHRDNYYYSVMWETHDGKTINGWKFDHDSGHYTSPEEKDIIKYIDNRVDNPIAIKDLERSNLKAMLEYYEK